jgi:pimeloyl-ACP methyl ester carboxylesterase
MESFTLYKSAAGEKQVMDLYHKTLANWPVPYQTFNIDTRHGKTFIIASGEESAKPLILLHGSCSNALSWIADIRKYSRHFRVLAVDIIGEPGRSSSTRPDITGAAYGEWLEDLLNSLNIGTTMIVGMSYGGWTALKFATYKPERVEKLALIAPGGIIPVKISFSIRNRLLLFMGEWGAKRINRILFGNQPLPAEVLDHMDLVMTNIKSRNSKMPVFSDDELKRITVPTLLLGGLNDPVQNIKRVISRMKKLSPQLTVNAYSEGGHVLPDSAKVIIPFLLSD